MPPGETSLFLRWVKCGELYAGSPIDNGDFIPDGTASGGRCHECGDEFEQVTLTSSD